MEPSRAKRILIVDDNESYRDMIRFRLELEGFEVVAAADGIGGLELTRKVRPDLVILDLTLPENRGASNSGGRNLDRRSGHKICRMIKFDQRIKHIPLLILTSSDDGGDIDLAVRSGADGYIMKTEKPELLLREINRLIEREAACAEAG